MVKISPRFRQAVSRSVQGRPVSREGDQQSSIVTYMDNSTSAEAFAREVGGARNKSGKRNASRQRRRQETIKKIVRFGRNFHRIASGSR